MAVEVSGWVLKCDEEPDGTLVITDVLSSRGGSLDLSAENSMDKNITRIDPQVFKNNLALNVLTLPAELKSFDRFLTTNFTGAGEENALILPARTIPAAQPWTLRLEGSTDGSAFNQWGSGLLATGDNALASSYNGGFQFYLAKAGTLTVKVGSSENVFSTSLGSSFTIEMEYNGVNQLKVTVSPNGGTPETKTLTQQLGAISTFSTAIPAGVNIKSLVIDDPRLGSKPFDGTAELHRIYVESGYAIFSDKDGILFDAPGSVLLHKPAHYDEIPTAIESVTIEDVAALKLYDLSGRLLQQPQRGICVTEDGRKILVK